MCETTRPPEGMIRLDWSGVAFKPHQWGAPSKGDNKIDAIKAIRRVAGLGLKEAKDHADGRAPLNMPAEHRDIFAPWVPLGLRIIEHKPKRPRKRRTCETAGCSRVAGDARFCRTCRAEAPVRAELARKTRAHRDEVQAYRTERGEIVRFLASAGITGASPVHAAKMAAARIQRDAELRGAAAADAVRDQSRLGTQTARANRLERDAADALGRLQAAHAERDELTAALQVARDHERGQAERLRRAKMQRDHAIGLHDDVVGGMVEAKAEVERYRADVLAVAQHRDRLECERHDAVRDRQSLALDLDWAEIHAAGLTEQRDTARGALGNAQTEARALRLRLRIMYAVASLLAVAAVVGGVL